MVHAYREIRKEGNRKLTRTARTSIFPCFLSFAYLLRTVWVVIVYMDYVESSNNHSNVSDTVDATAGSDLDTTLHVLGHIANRSSFATLFTAYSFVTAHLLVIRQLFVAQAFMKNRDDHRTWRWFL